MNLSPSHRDDSVLKVSTVIDHQSFNELPFERSNSLGIVDEENDSKKASFVAISQKVAPKDRLQTEKKMPAGGLGSSSKTSSVKINNMNMSKMNTVVKNDKNDSNAFIYLSEPSTPSALPKSPKSPISPKSLLSPSGSSVA